MNSAAVAIVGLMTNNHGMIPGHPVGYKTNMGSKV
jgi:hypothetical protein